MNFSASSDYCGDARISQHTVITHNKKKLTFSPEDTVLDAGCGTGEDTKLTALKVGKVTGIDPSKEMLDFAMKNNSSSNITYLLEDAQTVGDNPDLRGKFDKVVCFHVLHWVPDVIKALRSICDCLTPGGEALIIMDNQYDNFVPFEADRFLEDHIKWGQYTKGCKTAIRLWNKSIPATEDVLRSCGYANAHCEVQEHVIDLSEKQMKLFFKTIMKQLSKIPENEREECLEDLWVWVQTLFQPSLGGQTGSIAVPKWFMVMHAKK
ncbi:juvenile hormone acid O-methyltransferase-like [Asterias rubens]|uniref:juvenile hormone acid O-methyltransferase-like n=1 Tax=Asterias rubens TaxID=7604 RepID=UPI0014552DCB|nr:juvenile hormone acid O-methyltransferase-like [Asterias rubens]